MAVLRLDRDRLSSLALFAWAFILYLLTFNVDYSHDSDIIRLALDVEGYSRGISYPSIHQGWILFGRFIWKTCFLLGYRSGSFIPMQMLSLTAGALSVAALFLLMRALKAGYLVSILSAVCYSVSWHLLYFSSDNRLYTLGLLFFILICWLLLLPGPSAGYAAAAGALGGMVVLDHLGFYYFFPAAAAAILTRETTVAKRLINLAVFLFVTGLVFFAGTLLVTGSLGESLSFLMPGSLYNIWLGLNQGFKSYFLHFRSMPLPVLASHFWGNDLVLLPGPIPYSALYKVSVILLLLLTVVGFVLRAGDMFRDRRERAVWVTLAVWMSAALLSTVYFSPTGAPNVGILVPVFLTFGIMSQPAAGNRFIRPFLYLFMILLFSGMLWRSLAWPSIARIPCHPDPFWPEVSEIIKLVELKGEDVLMGPDERFGGHVAYFSNCIFIDLSRHQIWQKSGIRFFGNAGEAAVSFLDENRRVFYLEQYNSPSQRIKDEIRLDTNLKELGTSMRGGTIYQVTKKNRKPSPY